MEYFSYLGGMMTCDATFRYVKLNPGLLWKKQDLTRRILFHQQIWHKFKEETRKQPYLKHSFVWR